MATTWRVDIGRFVTVVVASSHDEAVALASRAVKVPVSEVTYVEQRKPKPAGRQPYAHR